jgi:hypothetical protein
LQRNAAHDSEAVGITLGGFERIVVAVVQARRHDDDAVDASLVHHWQRALDGEWFRQLRPDTRIPGPVRRTCFPEMHLGVDDRALACGLRPRLLCACGARCAGDQRRAMNLRRVSMMVLLDGAALWQRFVIGILQPGHGKAQSPARRFDRSNVRHYRLCAPSRGTRAAVSALNFKTTD